MADDSYTIKIISCNFKENGSYFIKATSKDSSQRTEVSAPSNCPEFKQNALTFKLTGKSTIKITVYKVREQDLVGAKYGECEVKFSGPISEPKCRLEIGKSLGYIEVALMSSGKDIPIPNLKQKSFAVDKKESEPVKSEEIEVDVTDSFFLINIFSVIPKDKNNILDKKGKQVDQITIRAQVIKSNQVQTEIVSSQFPVSDFIEVFSEMKLQAQNSTEIFSEHSFLALSVLDSSESESLSNMILPLDGKVFLPYVPLNLTCSSKNFILILSISLIDQKSLSLTEANDRKLFNVKINQISGPFNVSMNQQKYFVLVRASNEKLGKYKDGKSVVYNPFFDQMTKIEVDAKGAIKGDSLFDKVHLREDYYSKSCAITSFKSPSGGKLRFGQVLKFPAEDDQTSLMMYFYKVSKLQKQNIKSLNIKDIIDKLLLPIGKSTIMLLDEELEFGVPRNFERNFTRTSEDQDSDNNQFMVNFDAIIPELSIRNSSTPRPLSPQQSFYERKDILPINPNDKKAVDRLIQELDNKTETIKKLGKEMYDLRLENSILDNQVLKLKKKIANYESLEDDKSSESLSTSELHKKLRILREKLRFESISKKDLIEETERLQKLVLEKIDLEKNFIEIQTAHQAQSVYIQKLQDELGQIAQYKEVISQQEEIIKKYEQVCSEEIGHVRDSSPSGGLLGTKISETSEMNFLQFLANENKRLKSSNTELMKAQQELENSFTVTRLKQLEKELDEARAKIIALDNIGQSYGEEEFYDLLQRTEQAELRVSELENELIEMRRYYESDVKRYYEEEIRRARMR